MEPKEKRRGLGRGLSALMADVDQSVSGSAEGQVSEMHVPIERVHPNADQPRRAFDDEALAELSQSIAQRGILQPLIVRAHPSKSDEFEIVAGERRWRAAQLASVHTVPVVIRPFTDTEVMEVAIIENVQREDLNPVEEAAGYKMLMERFGRTQDQVASALGKSRSHIANLIRLLSLPDPLQTMLRDGQLTMGHARALLTADDPNGLAAAIVKKGLSVRDAERLAKGSKAQPKTSKPKRGPEKDADTRALESDLSAHLGMKVDISHASDGESGTVTLSYRDLEQLDSLCRLLSGEP